MNDTADITQWLSEARGGDKSALDRVLSTLYRELHGMARRQLGGQQYGHTLDTTALVHEAYLSSPAVPRPSSRTARTSSPTRRRRCAASWSTTRASAWR